MSHPALDARAAHKGMGEGGAIASRPRCQRGPRRAGPARHFHLASQPMSPSAIVTALMAKEDTRVDAN